MSDVTRAQLTPDHVRDFVLAGHAIFTAENTLTGGRFTFKVMKAEPNPKFPGDAWFVSVLTGSNNTQDYTYLGMIRNGEFRLTAKSRYGADTPSVKAFTFIWHYLDRLPAALTLWHEGRCGCCGRVLTVPESIASGIGPVCAEKGL
jgi:Family of unknown function (DUF6011)